MTLLDLYSGCGAMSTGLCLGASVSGLKLVTRWAVDINSNACESLKLNHPETEVRNEAAEDFLSLLKEWEKLCKEFQLLGSHQSEDSNSEQNSLDSDDEHRFRRQIAFYGKLSLLYSLRLLDYMNCAFGCISRNSNDFFLH
ncbi:unnamed protein product [Camellia sinensis]